MKVEKYICDKCNKEIEGGIFQLIPEQLDPKDGETLLGIPDEISDEIFEMLYNKHLCLNCVKRVIRFSFSQPAKVNEEFEAEIKDMAKNIKPIDECVKEKLKSEADKEPEESKLKKKRTYTKMKIEEVKELLSQGKTIDEIAELSGSNRSAIQKRLKYHENKDNYQKFVEEKQLNKVKPVHKNPNLTIENIKKLYVEQNMDIPSVAKELGEEVDVVRRFIISNRIFKNSILRQKYDRTIDSTYVVS